MATPLLVLGHPEVYVLILPAIGMVAEILCNNARRPLWGYKVMVAALFVLGFLSLLFGRTTCISPA